MPKHLLFFLVIGMLAGCGGWERDLAADKTKMQQAGWTYFETLGTPAPWTTTFDFDSSMGVSVGAIWTVNGVQQRKAYRQDKYLYYVQGYAKANGDSFAVVFQKEKPAKPAAP